MHTIGTTDLVRIPMRDAVDELRKLGIPVESIENQDLPI